MLTVAATWTAPAATGTPAMASRSVWAQARAEPAAGGRQHPGEFLAADAPGERRLGQQGAHAVADLADDAIAGLVTVAVVDRLQMVGVDHEQSVVAGRGRLRQRGLDPRAQAAAVEQAGEIVAAGQFRQRTLRLPFRRILEHQAQRGAAHAEHIAEGELAMRGAAAVDVAAVGRIQILQPDRSRVDAQLAMATRDGGVLQTDFAAMAAPDRVQAAAEQPPAGGAPELEHQQRRSPAPIGDDHRPGAIGRHPFRRQRTRRRCARCACAHRIERIGLTRHTKLRAIRSGPFATIYPQVRPTPPAGRCSPKKVRTWSAWLNV